MDLGHVGTLEELRAAVEAFQGCPLRQYATRTVFADGNPASGIMLIGEAPGAQEDLVGKPFVGRSGQLLDKMLLAIGLDRTSVYITNTIFWRPPDNRTPTPAETATCRPFLLKHVEIMKPQIIVLVGGTAAKTVLQTVEGIGVLRAKKWMKFNVPGLAEPIDMMATFHPAYLLRNPPAKPDAWEDLKRLRAKAIELGILEEMKGNAA